MDVDLSREAFARIEGALISFARRRFGQLIPSLAKAFFGSATAEERELPELAIAFNSFFVYGWRDPEGRAVVDMFAEHGVDLGARFRPGVEALRRARLVPFQVEDIERESGRLRGVDMGLGQPVSIIEHSAAQLLTPGDVLMSWQIPTRDGWRPIGTATHIPADRAAVVEAMLDRASASFGTPRAELAAKRPAHLFWLIYRVANMAQPNPNAAG